MEQVCYHIFFGSTHYICESHKSAVNLCRELGAYCIMRDDCPGLDFLIEQYRAII